MTKPLSSITNSHGLAQTDTASTALRADAVLLPDIANLPQQQLVRMRQAGEEILRCYSALKKAGLNIVGEVLRDSLNAGQTFYELEHYPNDDVYDHESHAQYYYHAHRSEVNEHGHFHTFLRPKGMPNGLIPIEYPATDPWPQGDQALSHLVAIAMDAYGYPTGLFTVNRWVTAEAWYPAEQVIRMLDCFVVDHAYPSWPVNRWLSAMFILYRPHIEALLLHRDRVIWQKAEQNPTLDVFEDRALDLTSYLPISVEEFIKELDQLIAIKQ